LNKKKNFKFKNIDLGDINEYRSALEEFGKEYRIDEVWHMAANSDIAAGIADPNIDLRDTYLTTHNTLILMKEAGIKNIYFASSSAIYGDLNGKTLSEDVGPILPISNYGAMKLASEAAISAAVESFLERGFLFRFPNVIGTPATHGVIFDFIHKLRNSPKELIVLGNGTQQKSYLHVDELIDAMVLIKNRSLEKLAVFNIGPYDEGVTVKYIAEAVVAQISPGATISYGIGDKGWSGDVPKFHYSIAKILELGWRPNLNSAAAIDRAVSEIAAQGFLEE
jgi:UDP-glucose 4-epimerase